MITIRRANAADVDAIWAIFHEIISAGDTYVQDEDFTADEARSMWLGPNVTTFVACDDGRVVGSYKILPNMPGRGAHVANGSYIVDATCRGKGVGRQMLLHSIETAKTAGYRAIQFNFVVSTNHGAVKLYEDVGFRTLAVLPGAFRHKALGYVDAYVMHLPLT